VRLPWPRLQGPYGSVKRSVFRISSLNLTHVFDDQADPDCLAATICIIYHSHASQPSPLVNQPSLHGMCMAVRIGISARQFQSAVPIMTINCTVEYGYICDSCTCWCRCQSRAGCWRVHHNAGSQQKGLASLSPVGANLLGGAAPGLSFPILDISSRHKPCASFRARPFLPASIDAPHPQPTAYTTYRSQSSNKMAGWGYG